MKKLLRVLPFIATIIFVVIGNEYNAWHPAWLVYLSIPLLGAYVSSRNLKQKVVNTSPFIALISFILIGYFIGSYHPIWLVFLWIPISKLLFEGPKNQLLALFLIMVSVYIYLYEPNNPVLYILLAVLLFAFGIISFNILIKLPEYLPYYSILLGIMIGLIYTYIGLTFGIWHPTWLLFFIIPISQLIQSQIQKNRFNLIPFMPFISTTLFFIIGEYLNRYEYAWLAFLLIPMVGALRQKK
jgi:hypothetical protein